MKNHSAVLSTIAAKKPAPIQYPTTDGKPMAETDFHRKLMIALTQTLEAWFAHKPKVYVSGNLLLYYEEGNKRKHVSPDVFVVRGVSKHDRDCYLAWEEGKMPEFVVEITSSSTRGEDVGKKFLLYRDVLKVKEYFLFDPFGDYLKPQLQGYRLHKGEYVPISLIKGRMPSKVLDLHLERDGSELRLYDTVTRQWLLTLEEDKEQLKQTNEQLKQAKEQAEKRVEQAEREQNALREEIERLRLQLEKSLRDKKNGV